MVTAAVLAVAVALLWPLWPAVVISDHGGLVGVVALPAGERLGLRFVHSVDGLPVEDRYAVVGGRLVQRETRLLSFGAGMGHVHGEGTGRADGRWWQVEGMARDVGTLAVRVGPADVDHRLRYRGRDVPLSACYAGERLTLRAARLPTLVRAAAGLLAPRCEP